MPTLREMLYLRPGEGGRTACFFALYLALFAAFSIADGAALALFAKKVGASGLPSAYAVTAAVNVLQLIGYVLLAERIGPSRLFQAILLVLILACLPAWLALRDGEADDFWYGALFVAREVAFTLVLMHFGTYLQQFFTRDELNRVLPVVYAGGRFGGIVGGACLYHLSGLIGADDMLPIFLGLCAVCAVGIEVISRCVRPVTVEVQAADLPVGPEGEACASAGNFLRFVFRSPLLFWMSISSVLFMTSRWFLNYRYTRYFQGEFTGESELAEFIGLYTQIALVASLVLQLFVVNRLVVRLGARGAYLLYGGVVFAGTAFCVPPLTMATALFARFLETELRLGLRNPLMQLLSNQFVRPLRLRVRAWTMGLLTPLGTGLASGLLVILRSEGPKLIGWAGGAIGLAFLLSTVGLYRARDGKTRTTS